ncbi:MAG: RDD family protein [Lysobacteraceae bacterium]|nr:MAG: RDD family protein [Xanthomonadaceae bacterium]
MNHDHPNRNKLGRGDADHGNPYHSPDARVADIAPQARLKIEQAGRWRRFFNFVIDYACYNLLGALAMVPYAAYLYAQGGDAALAQLEETNFLRDLVIAILMLLIYYIPMEALFGATIGKFLTGTRVVDERGGKPTLGQVVARSFARLIPFEPLSVLFMDEDKRGWHDSLAATYVVRKR